MTTVHWPSPVLAFSAFDGKRFQKASTSSTRCELCQIGCPSDASLAELTQSRLVSHPLDQVIEHRAESSVMHTVAGSRYT